MVKTATERTELFHPNLWCQVSTKARNSWKRGKIFRATAVIAGTDPQGEPQANPASFLKQATPHRPHVSKMSSPDHKKRGGGRASIVCRAMVLGGKVSAFNPTAKKRKSVLRQSPSRDGQGFGEDTQQCRTVFLSQTGRTEKCGSKGNQWAGGRQGATSLLFQTPRGN